MIAALDFYDRFKFRNIGKIPVSGGTDECIGPGGDNGILAALDRADDCMGTGGVGLRS